MKQKLSLILLFILISSSTESLFSQTTAKEDVELARQSIEKSGNAYNWNYFDTASLVLKDSIKLIDIQGLWKAYNGLFKFGETTNSMSLTQPFPIEIKDGKYRRSLDDKFITYTLNGNEITCKKEHDFGVINKLTVKLLLIAWHQGENHTM